MRDFYIEKKEKKENIHINYKLVTSFLSCVFLLLNKNQWRYPDRCYLDIYKLRMFVMHVCVSMINYD